MNIVATWEMEMSSWDKSTLATLHCDVPFNAYHTESRLSANPLKKIPGFCKYITKIVYGLSIQIIVIGLGYLDI